MVTSSQRDQRITVQEPVSTPNALNEDVVVWTDRGSEYAMMRWGSSAERAEAAQQRAEQTVIFTVQSTSQMRAVGIDWRIVRDGESWNIVGKAELGRDAIAFTCTRVVR